MFKRKILPIMGVLFLSQSAFACDVDGDKVKLLDKVGFQVSSRQWVSTQTALLRVNVNVTLKQEDMVQARNEIMNRLSQIAKGEWHITQFDRSQDNSGLDKLFVEAQARIPQSALTDVYKNAKNVSKPGANYQVSDVDFKPSLEEVQAIKDQLREKIYKQVNEEMSRLNQVYKSQHYTVNSLTIVEGDSVGPKRYMAKEMSLAAQSPAPLTVSNELIMTAVVEAASNRTGSKAVANAKP